MQPVELRVYSNNADVSKPARDEVMKSETLHCGQIYAKGSINILHLFDEK